MGMVIETIVSAQDVCAWFDTKLLLKKLKKKHSSVEFETECELDVFPELLQWNASGTLLYLEDVLGNWRILKTKRFLDEFAVVGRGKHPNHCMKMNWLQREKEFNVRSNTLLTISKGFCLEGLFRYSSDGFIYLHDLHGLVISSCKLCDSLKISDSYLVENALIICQVSGCCLYFWTVSYEDELISSVSETLQLEESVNQVRFTEHGILVGFNDIIQLWSLDFEFIQPPSLLQSCNISGNWILQNGFILTDTQLIDSVSLQCFAQREVGSFLSFHGTLLLSQSRTLSAYAVQCDTLISAILNGHSISDILESLHLRHDLDFPLQFTEYLRTVDFESEFRTKDLIPSLCLLFKLFPEHENIYNSLCDIQRILHINEIIDSFGNQQLDLEKCCPLVPMLKLGFEICSFCLIKDSDFVQAFYKSICAFSGKVCRVLESAVHDKEYFRELRSILPKVEADPKQLKELLYKDLIFLILDTNINTSNKNTKKLRLDSSSYLDSISRLDQITFVPLKQSPQFQCTQCSNRFLDTTFTDPRLYPFHSFWKDHWYYRCICQGFYIRV